MMETYQELKKLLEDVSISSFKADISYILKERRVPQETNIHKKYKYSDFPTNWLGIDRLIIIFYTIERWNLSMSKNINGLFPKRKLEAPLVEIPNLV